MKKIIWLVSLLSALLVAGCSSYCCNNQQPIYIDTPPVCGAHCTVTNNRGCWLIPSTPGLILILRSNQPLFIEVRKCGYCDQHFCVLPRMTLNTLVFGKFKRCCRSSDYYYPDAVHIPMVPVGQ